jgi:acetyl esterase/lipase
MRKSRSAALKRPTRIGARVLLSGCTLVLGLLLGSIAYCEPSTTTPRGSLDVAPFALPFSAYASPQAHSRFQEQLDEVSRARAGDTIAEKRAYYDHANGERVAALRAAFPVRTHEERIAGVLVDVVEPASRTPARNADRVLINLHGGAFLWGSRSGALVESIPIASLGRIKVVSVDYRLAPENKFPAATEDVMAVYRALLKTHRPEDIGIYGSSAGGYLTAEVTAQIIADKLPLPGAIGTLFGSLLAPNGDSFFLAPTLTGGKAPPLAPPITAFPYFSAIHADDPRAQPGLAPPGLKRFPATLLISGTRDFTLSSVLQSHRLLVQAGVNAELHVWDGMWHAFSIDYDMAESREAYTVIINFFDRHLGRHH